MCYKINEFYDMLEGHIKHPFDNLCITETWLSDGVSDNLVVDASPFNIFRCGRSHKVGGGCAILVRDTLTALLTSIPINSFENV